jgi:type I site-specific restriction endonuclease
MSCWIDIDLLKVQSVIKIRKTESGEQIFDVVRKKWITLQPEEWVRQLIVLYLHKMNQFPLNHFSIEKGVKKGLKRGRWDILIFDRAMKPFMLIECKSPQVRITDKVIFQAAIYNMAIQAPFIGLSNGLNTCCLQVNPSVQQQIFIDQFPPFPNI